MRTTTKSRRNPRHPSRTQHLLAELLEDRTLMANSNLPALLLLDPSGKGALNVTGNGGILVTGGGSLVIDSGNPQAAVAAGNGNVSAGEIDVTGNPGLLATGSGQFLGVIHSGVAPSADPLAGLPVPQAPATTFAAANYSGATVVTLSPGTYVGGVKASGTASITLLPGLYYLKGGGFTVTGQASVTGDGVVIYNAPQAGSDAISLTGQGNVHLTPPTGGTYQNITIFQDPASGAPISLTGNGNTTITGTVYAPKATLNVTGDGGLADPAVPSSISESIIYDLNVSGNGGFQADARFNNALTATAALSPAPVPLPDGTLVTNVAQDSVVGTTKPGAVVDLETGADGLFDEGHTTADASGHFSLPVTLVPGANLLKVRATSRFDQQVTVSIAVSLDTLPPTVTIASPAPGLLTDHNVTVSGLVTDNLSGVASLQARVDSGPFFDVTFDPSGNYSFMTALALDGSADGSHTVNLRATDRAGNASGLFSTSFDLESKPRVSILSPAAGTAAHTNITIVGHITVGLSGIASLTESLDNGAASPLPVDANGNFSFTTSLALNGSGDGNHVVQFIATDHSGKASDPAALPFIIDTRPPAVTVTAPTGLVTTKTNITVSGKASDALSGIASVQASVDSGPFAAVGFDPSGNFGFLTTLALDGNADGIHKVLFRGSDNAGNTFDAPFSFTLLTKAPAAPAFQIDPTANTGTAANPVTTAGVVTLIGHTDPNVTVTLVGPAFQTMSSNTGTFQFTNVPLSLGANTYTAQATDVAGTSSFSLTINRQASAGQGNAVLVWNQALLNAIQADASDPLIASRAMAMVQAAVFDAVSAIEGTPGYGVQLTAPAGASANAAVASAAHTVLSYLYPAQQAAFDAQLASSLGQVPDGQSKTDGVALGQSAGNAIIALRANDGWNTFVDYVPGSGPGVWVPTAPMYMEALDPQWATVQPWTMTSPSQFRPAGPPALNSQAWADAVNETESLGSATSTTRTTDQTQIARFWSDGSGSYTPPGHWNQVAAQAAQQSGDSLAEDARLFATLDITLADAAIIAWDAKYTDNAWRPITAIQNAATAGNPSVQADPNWTPLLVSPNFPEYVSGHSTFSAAAATVLDSFFGGSYTFSTTSPTLPGVTRSFTGFDQAAAEAGESRIYAGIHFEFSNQDGLAAGKSLASYALNFFNTARDTTPPRVALDNVLPSGASNHNVTLTGQVTDNLSGPASLTVQIDQGNVQIIPFDPGGQFAIPTSFALDGSADGAHTLTLVARDFAGNPSAPVVFSFVLGTHAPIISLTSPADNGTLASGATLAGTVTTTAAPVTALSYAFDNGPSMPVTFDATGAFNAALDLSKLTIGAHSLTVVAQDAAGNSATTTLSLAQPTLIPLTVTTVTPANGSDQVGATFRPKIVFSRPINPATLNGNDFFATDSTGNKLPATIVPAQDGTFAWLFFTNAMPGASTITLTIDGSGIKAADGTPLDAVGNGTPGSKLTSTFTTVNQAAVPGTSLTGILADPGPDLKPGTFDDVRPGPDGVLMTSDDVYLNPIAGARVYILGLENQAVFTDAQGRFTFPSVPSGDIKLVTDGRTATNAPSGMYFPEMVMDLTIKPGQVNTVMGSMGTRQETTALANVLGVYVPRLQNAILQPVSNTQPTMIGVPAQAAPDLTPQQRQYLTLEVMPNSAMGMDGKPMNNVQVGVSTVPTVLIRDMLPVGVPQPLITITVQAPGVAIFTTPVKLTFPNVYEAAPGTKLEFISFDHTTGRLEVEGTATVSADGLSVVTDPDSGLTHPGWHFVAPLAVFQGIVQPDGKSKGEHDNPSLLKQEYPLAVAPFSDPPALNLDAYALGQAAILLSKLRLSGDTVASGFFNDWLNGSTADLAGLNQIAAQELIKDDAFLNDVVETDIQDIKDSEPADNTQNFTVNLTPHQFAPTTEDLKFSYGRSMQCVSVSGSGNVSKDGGTVTDAELTYTFRITYGYGAAEAHKRPITDFAGDDFYFLRMMQLAGFATPFDTSLTFTVHIVNDEVVGDPPNPPVTSQTNMSTVPGFGTDPSIYYRFDLANGVTIMGKTDAAGNLNGILFPALTRYTGTFYSPSTNSWTSIVGASGPSGEPFGLSGAQSVITLDHFGGIDSTGDGLPDIARYVIGLKVGVRSFAGDGIDDAAKLAEGLDPLDGKAFPTGVIATLPTTGSVEKIAVDGNTIYAAGSGGLTVVDGTQFNNPIVRGHLALPGSATGVGVDGNLKIAAVATGSALQLVDVSNGMTPTLLHSVSVPAAQVVVADGVAYTASGPSLNVVDLLSGQVLQTLSLPGSGTVTGLARDGTTLYAFVSGSDTFVTIDISTQGAAVVRGQTTVSIASFDVGVFAANGIAWLAGSGLRSVDVSDPTKPTLIHGADFTFNSRRVALNGSGLGIVAPDGNQYIEIYDTSNPNATDNRLLQIPLSAAARDVAISRGIAYVGEGNRIEVVNYLPFDSKGVPPTATLSTSAADVDLLTPGLQVFEGTTLPVQANVADDVQVRDVALLVNGQVVQDVVSYPFNLSAIAPSISQGSTTFTLQVRATDTGGNVGLSNVVTVGLVTDTSPPTISSFDPANSSSRLEGLQTVKVRFTKSLAAGTVTTANFQLKDGGGNTITPSTLVLHNDDRLVEITYVPLVAGTYQLVINGPGVTDRVGNPLSAGNVTDSFTLIQRETLTVTNPDADPATPGFQLFEGTTVKGTVSVDPSVSVQRIDLVVNGQTVSTSTTAPFNFSFIAPLLSAGTGTLTLQALVTDTSGITTTSTILTVGLLKDVTPPSIVSTTPANGGKAFQGLQTIQINFSKPLATASATAANFQVVGSGPDGIVSTSDDVVIPITNVQLQNDDSQVVLTTGPLPVDTYQLRVIAAGITDRAGNVLGTGTPTFQFTVQKVLGVILVANNATNSVTAIDAATNTVRGSVSISPNGGVIGDVAVTADGTLGFVTNFASQVWVIDLSSPVPHLASGANPIAISNPGEDLALSLDQKYLLVTDGGGSPVVSVINIATRAQVSTFPISDSNSVDVMSDGSVLVSTNGTSTVRRLTLDASGQLHDTGQVLNLPGAGPLNVYGAPGAQAGVVVDAGAGDVRSFTTTGGLQQVNVRRLSGGSGDSAVISPTGSRVYVRSTGSVGDVDAFGFNSTTGALGATPLFTIPVSTVTTYYGIDQLAISPDGGLLYVPQTNKLTIYDANSGALLSTITDPHISSPTGVAVSGGQPQFFAGEPKTPAENTPNLTQAQLQPVVTRAIAQLATAGYNVNGLGQVQFHVADLPGSLLGLTSQNTIWIAPNAAGYGWYIDASPSSYAAFTQVTGTNEVQAAPGSPAYGHVDLLTVVTHELGHVLGFASVDPGTLDHDWMTATLGTGLRRSSDAAGGSDRPAGPGRPIFSNPPPVPTTLHEGPSPIRPRPSTAVLDGTAAHGKQSSISRPHRDVPGFTGTASTVIRSVPMGDAGAGTPSSRSSGLADTRYLDLLLGSPDLLKELRDPAAWLSEELWPQILPTQRRRGGRSGLGVVRLEQVTKF
jgi:hypothetical protein